MTNQIISIDEFLKLTGFKSRTSYYNLIKQDTKAPKPIRIGVRKIGLSLDEVHTWLESRKAERSEVA